jgi:hypothetical protein
MFLVRTASLSLDVGLSYHVVMSHGGELARSADGSGDVAGAVVVVLVVLLAAQNAVLQGEVAVVGAVEE